MQQTTTIATRHDNTKNVIVNYAADPANLMIDGENPTKLYYEIDAALTASGGKTVKARDIIFQENVIMTSPATIQLLGGYTNDVFTNRTDTSYTTINGSLKVRNGTLRVDRITVK